ncbi:hypothetical protein MPSEU_000242900 [Mayamaea pseudoterrestris]|nr:hypothetical protein MPSEU_000242900 [Mayamaea pseudoterrestris]
MWLVRNLAISLYLRQVGVFNRAFGLTPPIMPKTRRAKTLPAAAISKEQSDVIVGTPPKRRRVGKACGNSSSAAVTPSPNAKKSLVRDDNNSTRTDLPILFRLDDLVQGTLVARPSRRNKSPWVADVFLEDEQREALVHVPSLDMCGKCVPGATILVKPAKTSNGKLVGADALSPKYGTPKCEFTSQLLLVDDKVVVNDDDDVEAASAAIWPSNAYSPTWVGAHPSIGERVTEEWLRKGLILQELPPITSIQKQFTLVCDDGTSMRPDFMTTHEDGTKCLIEVKTVVDTDYRCLDDVPLAVKGKFRKNLVSAVSPTYIRTALFPSGGGKQKGPDGENVVSSRAIKHVQELTQIVQRSKAGEHLSGDDVDGEATKYEALIVFCVVRGDAEVFRPNHVACPSFAKYLKVAKEQGVRLLAKRTCWDESGACYSDKDLPIEWPESLSE